MAEEWDIDTDLYYNNPEDHHEQKNLPIGIGLVAYYTMVQGIMFSTCYRNLSQCLLKLNDLPSFTKTKCFCNKNIF
jgi:hypothetical protein